MDKNRLFMQNLMADEVPWHRITTAYGRATKFPEYFKSLYDMSDMTAVRTALTEITVNIEHQSTLWHSTPFTILLLTRIFEKAVSKRKENEIAYLITEQLLDFFGMVAECFRDINELENPDPLPLFSDMLKEEYLWSEEYDEDEDEMRYGEEEVFPDDLFYSFYYYSYQALLSCKPLLQQLENTDLDKEARKLQELL